MIGAPRPRPSLFFAALLLAFATCAGNLKAQPATPADPAREAPAAAGEPAENVAPLETDFFGLTETVVAGEPFGFEMRAWSSGPGEPSGWVSFQIPNGVLLAARPFCADWAYEAQSRQWRVDGPWTAGRIYSCRVELLAPENKGSLFLTLEKSTFHPDRYDRVEREMPMRDLPRPGRVLFRIGRMGFGFIELGVLFFFICVVVVMRAERAGLRRQREGPPAESGARRPASWLRQNLGYLAMIGVCLFFLSFFVVMAIDDWRARSFTETTCEVLDAEREVHESKSTDRRRTTTYSFDAKVSVAYDRGGLRTVTLAHRPESFLDLSQSKAAALLASLEQGASIPCWVDPRDHRKVLFDRGFGGAYFFALIPLGLLAGLLLALSRPRWWRRG